MSELYVLFYGLGLLQDSVGFDGVQCWSIRLGIIYKVKGFRV